MDAKSQAVLEFPVVRSRLAEQTNFPPSRRLAEALEPADEPVIIRRWLDETDEVRAFLGEHPGAGIGAAHDIGPAVERAARGGRLEPDALYAILETLEAAARLGESLAGERRPRLRELGRQIHGVPAVQAAIERSVDPSGEVLDTASPQLGGLRRAVRVAYDRLRSRLETLVHGSEMSAALQEPLVTLRNGRYVLPVRAEARGRVKGIVHDQSGSGQTLFVEPLVVVEMGNAWRQAQLAEKAEVERILDQLSALVGAHAGALRATLDALARFDFWRARARLGAEMDGVRAETVDSPVVELLGARHPGLSGRVVPVDIRLGGEYTALVITGPNTGGKTVTLRTLGLLALMHQAGLHVPALPGSRLPVFRDIFADIGDEQSVAQSLSTFSGHMRSIVRIVGEAATGTLVLLDELGAGTDPTEGSALARALLDHFIRSGALVAATTHYAELKTYAHTTPAARNASVDFDLETLSPTFHLTIGLPGTSQAFAIAERLGMPAVLVDDARSRLTRSQVEFEATLASIKAGQVEMEEALARATVAEEKARNSLREAEKERARARRAAAEQLDRVRDDAESMLATLQGEIRDVRGSLERETLTASRLDALEQRLGGWLDRLPPRQAGSETPAEMPAEWRVGMTGRSRSGGWAGRIAAIDAGRGRASLEAGGMRVEVELDDLEPLGVDVGTSDARLSASGRAGPGHVPKTGRRGEYGGGERDVEIRLAAGPSGAAGARRVVPQSLDLRGARVDEALDLLESYVDAASVGHAGQVTVIHGHGSGALRDAVRARLSAHPLVQSWRPGERGEGGDGATIVRV